jgi:excinuclease ABC subunit C
MKQSTVLQLKEEVNRFPVLPGVYLMKNASGEIIYIGKAKNLRNRVKTYFTGGDGRLQLQFLVQRIHSIDHIVTHNEEQAFILERDLISKHKPRYNIRLKDDKTYLSVRIDLNEEWPRLELVRRYSDDGALYFGPYTFGYELKQLLDVINRAIPLRTCTNTVFYNRQRPCVEYQIKRCAGPCCLPVDNSKYREWINEAISILQGKIEGLHAKLNQQMELASADLRFEEAAALRDRIEMLARFSERDSAAMWTGETRDAFSLYREERLAALSVLRVRQGRIADSINFVFSEVEAPDEDVLEAALEQFYQGGRDVPDEILVPMQLPNIEVIVELLKSKRGKKVEIINPQRGARVRLMDLSKTNARQHFQSKFDNETRYIQVAKRLARILKLQQMPRRIECIDISNLGASDVVGAIVVFFDGEPDRKSYRRFKISEKNRPDDFAAMREVVMRRLSKAGEEEKMPDLILIDGGPGQLSSAVSVRDELGAAVEVAALAKARRENFSKKRPEKPERIYSEHFQHAIALKDNSEECLFLRRIRDEAHRFVLSYHRQKRDKRVVKSLLDEIPGIGPERKGRLLRKYKSLEKIRQAPVEDLARTGRMSKLLAEKLLRYLGVSCQ